MGLAKRMDRMIAKNVEFRRRGRPAGSGRGFRKSFFALPEQGDNRQAILRAALISQTNS
jgi:hypothetical protein